jgi:hypothetical protein
LAQKRNHGTYRCSEPRQEEKQMKGHIRKRSPGHWAIILDLCDRAPESAGANGIRSRVPSAKRRCFRLISYNAR